MPTRRSVAAIVALAWLPCACASSRAAQADAGARDATADAPPDRAAPFAPQDAAPPGTVEAGTKCDALRAEVGALIPAALACTPNSDSRQCAGTTQGICCAISVSQQNFDGVNNLNAAVSAWRAAGCTFDCPKGGCPMAPSGVCDPTGGKGQCL